MAKSVSLSEDEESYTPIGSISELSLIERTKKVTSSVPKTLNLYWLSGTGLCVWLLFIHTPIWLSTRLGKLLDFPFVAHLIGVVGIYLACVINTLITPSWNRTSHIWVGRVGLALGYWGFVFGVYITWFRPGTDPSFGIPITIGGVAQIISQVFGYRAIKKFQHVKEQINNLPLDTPEETRTTLEEQRITHLKTHIACMIALFISACGIPASIRVVGDDSNVAAILTAVAALYLLTIFYTNNFNARIQSKNNAQQNSISESSPLVR